MYALIWLIPITLALAAGGLALFLWCARSGQFQDLDGPAWRILHDDDARAPSASGARQRSPNGHPDRGPPP